MTFTVTDVQKNKGGKFMHYGHLAEGELAVGDSVEASIDCQRRKAVCRAHPTTHLLDAALKKVRDLELQNAELKKQKIESLNK